MVKHELFDEAWYLTKYSDVAKAIQKGSFQSAWHHYTSFGRSEGRQGFLFDEHWYLTFYPDVAAAVEKGLQKSGLEHYMTIGFKETRRPAPLKREFSDESQVFAFGAFGTNNVGDEAIFLGIKAIYPEAIQIFHNCRTSSPAICFGDLKFYTHLFRSGDLLILGGGGLLYSKESVRDLNFICGLAKQSGARVELIRLGCEAAHPDYFDSIRELVNSVDKVSVRTTSSRDILNNITGVVAEIEPDFAFLLEPKLLRTPPPEYESIRIGLITGGDIRAIDPELVDALRQITRVDYPFRVNIVHIPHSRSFIDMYNNDMVIGSALWSLLDLHEIANVGAFSALSFCEDPLAVLSMYNQLDAVISARFHGLVFARLAQRPALALDVGNVKNKSFLADYSSSALFAASSESSTKEAIERFVRYLHGVSPRPSAI